MPGQAEHAPYPHPVHPRAMPVGQRYREQKTSQRPSSSCRSLRRSFNSLLTNPFFPEPRNAVIGSSGIGMSLAAPPSTTHSTVVFGPSDSCFRIFDGMDICPRSESFVRIPLKLHDKRKTALQDIMRRYVLHALVPSAFTPQRPPVRFYRKSSF